MMRVSIIERKSQLAVTVIGQRSGSEITMHELQGFNSAHWQAEPLADGTFRIRSDWANGKVWDVVQASQDAGAPLIVWDWHGGPNQRFRVADGLITAVHSGKRIGVSGDGEGRAVVQTADGQSRRFRVGAAPITSMNSPKVLDVPWASTENGVQLCQFGLHGGPNQRFLLEELSSDDTRDVFRIVAEHSGKVLDVEKASRENGARIIQWPWHGGANQLFYVRPIRVDGGYGIINVGSGKAVDVWAWGKDDGVPIIQWDWHGGANQRWLL
ncbi:RICIN domain-containing protein [Streptomyces sp. NPDC056716]|uniref:RICIN domain-containing protein n=1 Tax=unclassified Streptomyces TaxID=2593676 RepID=UPI0036A4CC79